MLRQGLCRFSMQRTVTSESLSFSNPAIPLPHAPTRQSHVALYGESQLRKCSLRIDKIWCTVRKACLAPLFIGKCFKYHPVCVSTTLYSHAGVPPRFRFMMLPLSRLRTPWLVAIDRLSVSYLFVQQHQRQPLFSPCHVPPLSC